ncbi:SWIM zinc finger family protein [Mycobacterium talmoniae]|uniref:SWIM zinc finger family protein n=1 Tax=Mycobacterium talmoniae TaxID=1858794 RepID=UPI000A56AB03|nr:SWIM zinc finger family protein [Mycobacterium talmoniae]
MTARADLLELTGEALTALANPGFVKRARKDLDAGRVPDLAVADDGSVTARFPDGVVTTLPPGVTVKDAACSCPASGWCRHRVILVLAYQDRFAADAGAAATQPWTPAVFDDDALAVAMPAATLAAARRAARRLTVRLATPAGVPTARLPLNTVQFFSPSSLAHARCDCREVSGCAHVAVAVWAFRAAGPDALSADEIVVTLGGDDRVGAEVDEFDAGLSELVAALWLDGAAGSDAGVDARLGALIERARRAGWSWVVADLEELSRQRDALHHRRTDADPDLLLTLVTEAPARLRAARAATGHTAPQRTAAEILGVGVPGEAELAHLRLISLGAQCWREPDGVGARVYLADPDTGQVSVLERRWSGTQPAAERRLLGAALRRVAQGQVVTGGARRRALGLIDISADRRRTAIHPLGPRSWDGPGLPHGLRTEPLPAFTRPRRLGSGIRLLTVEQVGGWGFDAAAQELVATLGGPDGELRLVLPQSAASPGALDALAQVLDGEVGALRQISGQVSRHHGRLVCQPLAVATDERTVVLATASPLGRVLPPAPVDVAPGGPAVLVDDTRRELSGWLRRGLRQQGRAARDRLAGLADRLTAAAMPVTGAELAAAVAAVGDDTAAAIVALQRVSLLLTEIAQGG